MTKRVSAVILAAGPSRRFAGGRPKQLASFAGETLVRRATRAALASRVDQVLVVVGFQASEVAAEIDDLGAEVIVNERYREGQSSSVKAGLEHVEHTADGALIAVRTYGSVWLFERGPGQSLAEALAGPPCEGGAAAETQGEAVGFLPSAGDGQVRYVTVSEGDQDRSADRRRHSRGDRRSGVSCISGNRRSCAHIRALVRG